MTSLLHRAALLTALLFIVAGWAACDGADEGGSATVRVLLTDAPFPFDLAAEANVTILRVELTGGDEEDGVRELVVFDEPRRFNLLELRDGVTAELGDVRIDRAGYRQLRFIVDEDAEVVFFDGRTFDLKVPSGSQTGIKVNLPAIDPVEGDLIVVTADFDVEDSFVTRGNPAADDFNGFLFKPVLHLEEFVVDGVEVEIEETEADEEN